MKHKAKKVLDIMKDDQGGYESDETRVVEEGICLITDNKIITPLQSSSIGSFRPTLFLRNALIAR